MNTKNAGEKQKCCRFTQRERVIIEEKLLREVSIPKIAKGLNRPASSVYYEVKKHSRNGKYEADSAHSEAMKTAKTSHGPPRLHSGELAKPSGIGGS